MTNIIEVSRLSVLVVKAVGESVKEVGVATEDYVRFKIIEPQEFLQIIKTKE